MKRFFGYALILAFLSAPAFAAKNSQSVHFVDPVMVGSTQLPAGEYKVTWTGTGSNVQVAFEQNGKTDATVSAKLVEEKHDHAGFTIDSQSGKNVLEVLQLSKVSLVLGNAPSAGQ